MSLLIHGDVAGRKVSARIAEYVASTSDLTAIPAAKRVHGMVCLNVTDGTHWYFNGNSSATASDIVKAPDAGSGRWLAISNGPVLQNITATIGHADLTTAVNGTAQAINVGSTLPAGAYLAFIYKIHLVTPFSGGSVSSLTVALGTVASPTGIWNSFDGLGSAGYYETNTVTAGALASGFACASTQVKARFTPDGGHAVSALTAGSIIISAYYYDFT